MNKKLYFSICISFLCAFLAVYSVILTFALKKAENYKKENIAQRNEMPYSAEKIYGSNTGSKTEYVPQNISSEKVDHYFAISRGNDVVLYVIYESGKKEFKGSIGISTLTMRKRDKENFKDGVTLKTHEDVLHLIEDYTS